MTLKPPKLKKIQTDNLTEGMFVHDVGRSWLSHPWKKKSKLITSKEDIRQLREYGITEVVIDLARGIASEDVARDIGAAQARRLASETQAVEAERKSTQAPPSEPDKSRQLKKPTPSRKTTAVLNKRPVPKVSLAEEMLKAEKAYSTALESTREFMADARAGKQVNVPKIQEDIEELIGSTTRNQDASLALMKLKTYDEYTYTHALNVGVLALCMGNQMGLSHDDLQLLGLGAMLHDVGKVLVPQKVLNKPSRLNEREFAVIKKHPLYSWKILQKTKGIDPQVLSITRHHHERADGNGYPDGLNHEQIEDFVAVTGVSDVYDALSSDRIYRKGMLPHHALKVIFTLRDEQFDSVWIEGFVQCLGIYPAGTLVRLNSGEMGVTINPNGDSLLRPTIKAIFDHKGRRIPNNPVMDLSLEKFGDRQIEAVLDPREMNLDLSRYL